MGFGTGDIRIIRVVSNSVKNDCQCEDDVSKKPAR